MTGAFSWENSISLCPASFCTPRPNLPVTPSISWLPTFAFQSPIMKRTFPFFFFLVLVLQDYVGLHRTVQLQLLQRYWSGIDLVYCDIEWFTLETNTDHSVIFEIASKYCILGSFVEVWDCKICSYFLSIMNLDSFEFGELFLHPRYNFCVR